MSRKGWGASKFGRNQLRIWAVNPNSTATEPAEGSQVSGQQFMDIIEPIFNPQWFDYESKCALLKKSCLLVATADEGGDPNWLYWRAPTADKVDVQRLKFKYDTQGSSSLVNNSAHDMTQAWTTREVRLPENYEEQLAWEEQWMNAVLSHGALEIPRMTPRSPAHPSRSEETRVPPTPSQTPGEQGAYRVQAGADGQYVWPCPHIASGSVTRSKFNFASAVRATAVKVVTGTSGTPAPQSAAASSSSGSSHVGLSANPVATRFVASSGAHVVPKSSPEGTGGMATESEQGIPAAKRVKTELLARAMPDTEVPTTTLSRSSVKRQLDEDANEGLRILVDHFARVTKESPICIEDSPPKVPPISVKREEDVRAKTQAKIERLKVELQETEASLAAMDGALAKNEVGEDAEEALRVKVRSLATRTNAHAISVDDSPPKRLRTNPDALEGLPKNDSD